MPLVPYETPSGSTTSPTSTSTPPPLPPSAARSPDGPAWQACSVGPCGAASSLSLPTQPQTGLLNDIPVDASAETYQAPLCRAWLDAQLSPDHDLDHVYDTAEQFGYLAANMRRNHQQTLYLETIHVGWLNGRARQAGRLLTACLTALAAGLSAGLAVGFGVRFSTALFAGLGVGLSAGLIGGLSSIGPSRVGSRIVSPRAAFRRSNALGGLFAGLIAGLGVGLIGGLGVGLYGALIAGLGVCLIGGVGDAFVQEPKEAGRSSQPMGALRVSAKHGLSIGLVRGSLSGVGFGVGFGLFGGVAIAGFYGLGVGMTSGLVIDKLRQLNPRAAFLKQWIRFTLVAAALFAGLLYGLVGWLAGGLLFGLVLGLFFAFGGGLGLMVSHFVARVVLAAGGRLPLRLERFLDNGSNAKIIYRSGPGYRFRHSTLMDYLAEDWEARHGPL